MSENSLQKIIDACGRLAVDDAVGPLVRTVFGVTLFVPDIWRPERRAAAAAIINEHMADANGRLTNWRDPKTGRWVSHLPIDPSEWLGQMSPEHEWTWEACGATPEVADPWSIIVLGVPNWQTHSGFVRVTWPLSELGADPGRWVELMGKWGDALKAEDGQAGPLLIAPPEIDRRAAAETDIRVLAESHIGLLVDAPITFALYGSGFVKTVGWLTYVGDRFEVPELASSAMELRAENGRVYCQGALPALGGALGSVPPPGARKIAKGLEPFLLRSVPGLQMAGPGRFDETAATSWLRRFDEKAGSIKN